MTLRHRTTIYWRILLVALALLFRVPAANRVFAAPPKQESLDQWRRITSAPEQPPRVYVRGDRIRFVFETETGSIRFRAHVDRSRVPTRGYKVHTASLKWDETPAQPLENEAGWQQAAVISGTEWRRLSTNLLAALAPEQSGHGFYYQGFLADRLLYRDNAGAVRSSAMDEQPQGVLIEGRFSTEETLQKLATVIEELLGRSHPDGSLFLIVAPNSRRLPQPLLLDRRLRRCIWLSPAALLDSTDRGFSLSTTVQGISTLLFESHGLALLKCPVSSVARLADLGAETLVRFLRLPLPRGQTSSLRPGKGMDLTQWEKWLDQYTGTRNERGTMDLLIDGDRFFPRLEEAIKTATNHINLEVFIFDKDDVAVQIADHLRQRATEVPVRVILDQMGSMAAGLSPPATPLPEGFTEPPSITSYLRHNSHVQVRPFLNPWFSVDHSKVYLVDGKRAWLGGMNLGREYRSEWHDLMLEVTGPVVASLERDFQRHWAHEGLLGDLGYTLTALNQLSRSDPPPGIADSNQVRRLPTRTLWKPFSAAVQASLSRAQNYIYVENPYLFDRRVIRGLVQARNRGVDVRVILPRVNDFKLGERSNLVVADYLRAHGVRVFFFPGMTHVKALLVDDWACVGSGNLNHLSLRLCQEENLATSDPVFSARLKHDLFQADFGHSYELTQPITIDWVDYLADLALEGF